METFAHDVHQNFNVECDAAVVIDVATPQFTDVSDLVVDIVQPDLTQMFHPTVDVLHSRFLQLFHVQSNSMQEKSILVAHTAVSGAAIRPIFTEMRKKSTHIH